MPKCCLLAVLLLLASTKSSSTPGIIGRAFQRLSPNAEDANLREPDHDTHQQAKSQPPRCEHIYKVQVPLAHLPITEILCLIILLELAIVSSKISAATPSLEALFVECTKEHMGEHGRRDLAPAQASRTSPRARNRTEGAVPLVERVLRTNAATFSGALLGEDDVDLAEFMRGCREFRDTILAKMGSFTTPAAKQVSDNLAKIETIYALQPERFRSMRAILEEEVTSQMHSRMRASGLADPSAAMGLLWARRGLQYWIVLFRPLLDGTGGPPGYHEAMAAYEQTIGPYNGWVMRNMVSMTARVTPAGHGLMGLAPSNEELLEDMRKWTEAVGSVLARGRRLHEVLDLEDQTKTL